jgi:CRISPR-associated protein Csm1
VSLFDHLKTSAAIAICLYDWEKSEKNSTNSNDPFLMIGADFSGIQNYIYNIISKSAAKNLKGRSFYVKLLSDSIVTLILQELDLFEANVIYNAGGGFFILAPNTPFVAGKLTELRQKIEDKILETHGTSIYVAIDSICMSKETLMGKDRFPKIGDCWTTLFEKRDILKKQRYKNRIIQEYELFFEPGEHGGITRRDAITGEEIPANAKNIYTLDGNRVDVNNLESEVVQELTYKQISLGRKLKQADVWVISNSRLNYWPDKESINPGNLGIYYYFLSEKELNAKAEKLKNSADWVKILTINANTRGQCDFINPAIQGSNNVYGFDFLGGNDYPIDENGDPKFFDELAGEDGFRRLGILRMDV